MHDAELLHDFRSTRERTLTLIAPLTSEDCQIQVCPDVSPTKWHLAHTTWFFERAILQQYIEKYIPFDSTFDFLFNSYYEGAGPHIPREQRGFITRPALDVVQIYRQHVEAAMLHLLHSTNSEEVVRLTRLGIEHEKQHQELILTDIKRTLFANPQYPAYRESEFSAVTPGALQFTSFGEQLAPIGYDEGQFSFDNERPIHQYYVKSFQLANRLVSNGEYLQFVQDSGYTKPSLWLSDGYDINRRDSKRAPDYWIEKDGEWFEFTLVGLIPLNANAPASHVSFYEADAFARWSNSRLPTEFEWETAARQIAGGAADTQPVLHPTFDSGPGIRQMFGQLWQWTTSYYLPYPGFQPDPGLVAEYNGKFMNEQRVLRGSSCATPAGHARTSYRNYFRGEKTWQFTGIRLAKDIA
jgi:ergothioneine biosynthesis protein EgtB